MNTDEIASKIKLMFEKEDEIRKLNKARQDEEAAIVAEYKVDECNSKRAAIVAKYANLQSAINAEIKSIQDQLASK